MSAALRLAQLQKLAGGEPLAIAVLEKAREAGAHMLSGAVLDPRALNDLVPNFTERGAPLTTEVHHDHVYFLTRGSKVEFPVTPPPLRNHGHYIVSLNRFVKWLAGLVEAEGIDLFTGFSAMEVLYEDTRVVEALVAGDAAMLVAKAHKLHDRQERDLAERIDDKDAADVVRIMQTADPATVGATLAVLTRDPVAGTASANALVFLDQLFGRRGRPGIEMATRALRLAMPQATIETLCVAYTRELRRVASVNR